MLSKTVRKVCKRGFSQTLVKCTHKAKLEHTSAAAQFSFRMSKQIAPVTEATRERENEAMHENTKQQFTAKHLQMLGCHILVVNRTLGGLKGYVSGTGLERGKGLRFYSKTTVFRLTFDFNVEDAASEWRIHRADDVPSEIEDVAVHRFNVKEFAVFTLQFEELSLYALGGYVAHDPVFLQEKAQRDATSTKNYQRTTITIGSETTKKESGSFWSVAVKAENWNRRLKSLH